MRARRTDRIAALALAAALLLAGAARAGEDRQFNRGFQLGVGWGVSDLTVDLDDRVLLPESEQEFDSFSHGPDLICGYGFGPYFRTEFTVHIGEHDSPGTALRTYNGGLRFDGVFTLLPKARLQPELLAGMGWYGLIYDSEESSDYFYAMLQGSFGAGLRWRIGDHWALGGQYVFSILDVEREIVGDLDSDEEGDLRFVGGDGHLHRIALRMVYDF